MDVIATAIGLLLIPVTALSLLLMRRSPEIWVFLISGSAALCGAYSFARSRYLMASIGRFLPLFLIFLMYLVSLAASPNFTAVKHVAAFSAILLIFVFYVNFGAALVQSPVTRTILALETLVLFGSGLLSLNVKNYDMGVSLYAACLLFYLVTFNSTRAVALAASFVLFLALVVLGFLSNFRALFYLSLIVFSIFYFENKYKYTEFRSWAIFILFVVAMYVFFYLYINIDNFAFTRALNIYIQEKTGRQLESGRQDLWPFIIDYAMQYPFFGAGASALPSDFLATKLSSHNYYIQLFLQMGGFGLAFMLLFLGIIWKAFGKARWSNTRINFSSAVFLCLMVHNMTEVVLFQNALVIAVPAWVVVALGLSEAIHRYGGPQRVLQRHAMGRPQVAGLAAAKMRPPWGQQGGLARQRAGVRPDLHSAPSRSEPWHRR